MLKPKSRWIIQQADKDKTLQLAEKLNISPFVAALLVNRKIEKVEEARAFLFAQDENFHDPFLFYGMETAVERIRRAVADKEPILIYGDYDADGVTSTSLLFLALRRLGAVCGFYIPNRFTEGYGPNETAFRHAADEGVKLIITVDNGIAALHEAEIAKELGMDLIITDHHEPGPKLPEAYAIIHPKHPEGNYPFKELAGVGVSFKLAHALLGDLPEELLDLAAIGTVADLVPLKGENRLIVKRGLEKLRLTERAGLKALIKSAGLDLFSINEESIGFQIGPRLNAAGRLDSADPAVELILTEDPDEAAWIAEEIEELNRKRQKLVNEITEEAIQEVEKNFPPEENAVLLVGKEGWNAGVIGIVASKLVEKYYRPTIVFSYDEEKGIAKGSARSIEGFDLFKNLSKCRDLLPHFGGHTMAAGMTLNIADMEELRNRLNRLAREELTDEDFTPLAYIDYEASIGEITVSAIEEMEMLAPFGEGNPKPKVLIKDASISQIRKIGANQTHLKVMLADGNSTLDGVGFGLGHLYEKISPQSKLSVIGELGINEWNNLRKPQIFLHDMAVFDWQLFDYRGVKKFELLREQIPGGLWILFNEKNKKAIPNGVVIETYEQAKQLHLDGEHVVLADFPPSKQMLENLFAGKKPARIYAHFYKEQTDFFSTMPTREHFKWFYAFLLKKSPFDLRKYGNELAKYRGWTKETVDFMSQVFLELQFITETNGLISIKKLAGKKDLADSPTYKRKLENYNLEKELLYSNYDQLKSWFDSVIGKPALKEEAVKWI